jgi:hydroxypyruvate reductase
VSEDVNRQILTRLFEGAVASVSAEENIPPALPGVPRGRTVMIAVGKGAASMAKTALQARPDIECGLVVMPYGHGVPGYEFPPSITVIEASHPVPDTDSLRAAQKALALVQSLGQDDQLLALISGGGSSLLAFPVEGLSLARKKKITSQLLYSGATIQEMNSIRSHLSHIKGGRLGAAAYPAEIVTLVISDVPGDDPAFVASGPTIPMGAAHSDIVKLAKKYSLPLGSFFEQQREPLRRSANSTKVSVIATADKALSAARRMGEKLGYDVVSLGGAVEGEARMMAEEHSRAILSLRAKNHPCLLLSGGETSVTISTEKPGRGGRNCEYLLALAIHLQGAPGVYSIACDTDGIDGSEKNAGAIITPTTLSRAKSMGLDAKSYLDSHDSYSFFDRLNDLVITGPTRTNVNDFRASLINP